MDASEFDTFKNNCGYQQSISIACPELTFLCPKTGQPDFGFLTVTYIPHQRIIELKSFKNYIWAFRDQAIGYERLMSRIYMEIMRTVVPHKLELTGVFNVRGGLTTTIKI